MDQSSHLVYVLDTAVDSLYRFDRDGNPAPFAGSASYLSGNQITGLNLPDELNRNQVAVSSVSHRIYVTSGNAVRAFEADGEPAEFSSGPGAGTNEIATFFELRGLAVDSNGAIYTDDANVFAEGETITVFEPSGAVIAHANTGTLPPGNLAVDGSGNIYMQSERVVKLEASSFPVTSETKYSFPKPFGPRPSLTVAVDPNSDDVYIAESGDDPRIARYDESGALLSSFAGEGEEGEIGQSEGIGIDGASARVFVADFPPAGLSQVAIFQPVVAAPTIERIFVRNVAADSAILGAEINPNTRATNYYFEYGPGNCVENSCKKVPAGAVPIGNGHNVIVVSQPIRGLSPETIYHYRVVAENDLGGVTSPPETLATQGANLDLTMSDARQWEMVSPPLKFGGILLNPPGGPMQAAENGDGLAYQSLGSIDGQADGNRAIERSTILARRGIDGWNSRDLTPPHAKAVRLGAGNEFDVFSRDLRVAALEPQDANPLSPSASFKTPYLRINEQPPTFVPLVTSKEGHGNVPPGLEFGSPNEEVTISGASPDLAHVVLNSEAPLAPGAQRSSLYAWHNGRLEVVSALPAGEGGTVVAGLLGTGKGSTRNAVSQDGSRVFWSQGRYEASGIDTTALFLRDLGARKTIRLDVPQPGATGAGDARPAFQGASADGSVVFFSDTRQLTEDASAEGRDLYRCELLASQSAGCDLINVTAPRVNPGESAQFQGVVSAFGEDGGKVYFVAEGILTGEPNERGQTASSGQANLYLWAEGEGVRYIATLSPEDRLNWGIAGSQAGYSRSLSAAGSPSGRYFSFMSELSLTGYDNRDADSGLPSQEIFLYDSSSRGLRCVSCNPSGSVPESERIHVDSGFAMVDPQGIWQDRLVAAVLPEARKAGSFEFSFYRPRAVLDSGRVFFNAVDSLVPADSNGTWDVYQYEPSGAGSCTPVSVSASIVKAGDACLGLISSGTADEEAAFLDASVTGDDVFFLTPARLSVLDKDTIYDVYDARVNGSPAALRPASKCDGEDCRPSTAPPSHSSPASESFRPAAKRLRCPKGKRKVKRHGRVRCIPRKHHKKMHHKKAGQTRRANR
ncbi:MAG TPA: hypothetical protein VD761_03580 [Solirubrobacterales bacterium]|nr:hypothetical protein [Solirubrobacterales bacterium]